MRIKIENDAASLYVGKILSPSPSVLSSQPRYPSHMGNGLIVTRLNNRYPLHVEKIDTGNAAVSLVCGKNPFRDTTHFLSQRFPFQ
mgnify:CR=1 FL=1